MYNYKVDHVCFKLSEPRDSTSLMAKQLFLASKIELVVNLAGCALFFFFSFLYFVVVVVIVVV